MDSEAEHRPDILVRQHCREHGKLELKKVVLSRVHVHSMNTPWVPVQNVAEDIISGRGDCEDDITFVHFKKAVIYLWVLPGEGVDVVIFELGVSGMKLFVINPPGVVLVEAGGERDISGEVEHCSFEALAAELEGSVGSAA